LKDIAANLPDGNLHLLSFSLDETALQVSVIASNKNDGNKDHTLYSRPLGRPQ
jgi:hypothetical protein